MTNSLPRANLRPMRKLIFAFPLLLATAAPSRTLSVLQSFPRHTSDRAESAEHRQARLSELADTIDAATQRKHERALLITIMKHESELASYVQFDADDCRRGKKGRCDGGKAWGLPQLHGTDRQGGIARQVELALKLLRYGAGYCKGASLEDKVLGAIALYATGKQCEWKGAPERVKTWTAIMAKL